MGNDLASEWDAQDQRQFGVAKSRRSISITGARLWAIRIVSLPCMVLGMVLLFDMLVATPEHELAMVKDKYSVAGKGVKHYIHVYTAAWGGKDIRQIVPSDFYNECTPGDVVKLTLTPRYKQWKHIVLLRRGKVVDERTLAPLGLMGFLLLLPLLTWIPRIAATQATIFWTPVILFEAGAIIFFVFNVCVRST
jgi:hypothetical protein